MVEYKNQHFVPEFYLEFFSEDGESVWISNLDAEDEFKESISNVASRNYFYSREHNKEVEQTISDIEGQQSTALTTLQDRQRYDALDELTQFWVRQFLTFQMERTRAMKERHIGQIRELIDKLEEFSEVDPSEEVADRAVETSAQDTLLSLMADSRDMELYLRDLEAFVLVNESDSEFVTSDDPVFLHNSYSNAMGSVGLRRVGLEIYCPISRRQTLMLFDPNVYDVPDANQPIGVGSEKVQALNGLQRAGANNNLFYARSGLYEDFTDIESFSITGFHFIRHHSSPDGLFRNEL